MFTCAMKLKPVVIQALVFKKAVKSAKRLCFIDFLHRDCSQAVK